MGGCGSKDGVSDAQKKKGGAVSAYKSADELTDFSKFFPAGTSSKLSKHLTQEMWDEYKD